MKLIKIIEQIINNAPSAFFYTPGIFEKSKSYLFIRPEKKVFITDKDNIKNAFNKLENYLGKGFIGWGMIPYEFGYLFDKKLKELFDDTSLRIPIQFYLYNKTNVKIINSTDITLDDQEINSLTDQYKLNNIKINTSIAKYTRNIKKIKKYITEGETYQVNYTVKSKFDFEGSLTSLFINMIFNQSSKYTALINDGENFNLSFSPELFFSASKGKILTKPMKGTIKRGINIDDDNIQKLTLANNEKEKAENIMIVDLLRNDLGKISNYNSVKVNKLFDIEQFESLFQMTSCVSSKLRQEINFGEIISGIFPCGSVTGAPKIRTMQIIKEIESEPRGIYTGSFGMVKKSSYNFNVAIRTLQINQNTLKGELGIGSGIVWDSDPEKEYQEVLLKSKFLLAPEKYFELFESILIEDKKPFLLKYHCERIKEGAKFFQFIFDEKIFLSFINNIIKETDKTKKYKLKVILNKWGNLKHEINEIQSDTGPVNIIISKKSNYSKNKFLYFKTTSRLFYDNEFIKYKTENIREVIFLNEKKEVTEGTSTNIFIRKKQVWLTPAIQCGLLSGTYRKYFLQKNKKCKETIMYLSDLLEADEIILVNSVRKEIKVGKLYINKNEVRCFLQSKEFNK